MGVSYKKASAVIALAGKRRQVYLLSASNNWRSYTLKNGR
ncbi:hypothetical protein DFO55_101498 [Grimontella sp. AG753]|jgi:hypothetical protein|nr:hypothetical protein DFO55_101498 [Grimontella sp. AG753]